MIWVIVLLAILIFLVFIFYLIIFLKFRKFINEDKDRIRMFSDRCLENLQEVSNQVEVPAPDEQSAIENNDSDNESAIINADDF